MLVALWPCQLLHAQVFLADDATYETCSGVFHDSGGPTGNYGNNESFVTTICPVGGAGSGPFTSVLFTAWAVAPGPGDQLEVFDGNTVAGTLLAVGSASNSLNGLSFLATDASGCLTFRWTSDASGTAAGWAASITTGPNAGRDTSITVCTSDAPFNMRLRLAGSPPSGGTWTAPGGATLPSSLFDPATFPAGNYVYTLTGTAPCPPASATLSITKVEARDPGSSASLTLCDTDAPVALINALGGSPEPGGTWTGPNGAHSGTFDPAVDDPGVYTYTLVGNPPCPNATSTVTVAVNDQPNPGISTTTTVCSNGAPVGVRYWAAPPIRVARGPAPPVTPCPPRTPRVHRCPACTPTPWWGSRPA